MLQQASPGNGYIHLVREETPPPPLQGPPALTKYIKGTLTNFIFSMCRPLLKHKRHK